MDNQVNYYAVIPANVRYDKDLPANAKLLYGEITALCNNKGFCWATNQYFADLYGVKKLAVSRWINALADKGYIFIVMEPKNDHTQELIRKISLPQIPTSKKIAGVIKKDVPPHQKRYAPISKKIGGANPLALRRVRLKVNFFRLIIHIIIQLIIQVIYLIRRASPTRAIISLKMS